MYADPLWEHNAIGIYMLPGTYNSTWVLNTVVTLNYTISLSKSSQQIVSEPNEFQLHSKNWSSVRTKDESLLLLKPVKFPKEESVPSMTKGQSIINENDIVRCIMKRNELFKGEGKLTTPQDMIGLPPMSLKRLDLISSQVTEPLQPQPEHLLQLGTSLYVWMCKGHTQDAREWYSCMSKNLIQGQKRKSENRKSKLNHKDLFGECKPNFAMTVCV